MESYLSVYVLHNSNKEKKKNSAYVPHFHMQDLESHFDKYAKQSMLMPFRLYCSNSYADQEVFTSIFALGQWPKL